MPETVPGVTFRDGLCNFCLDYKREEYRGKEALDKIVRESTNSNNSKYDCIVPISGGRDSTYILYLAKAVYGLKVLAVNYDNEFRVEQALVNMQKACKTLHVDFVTVRSKRNIAKRMVRSQIRFALSEKLPSIDGGLCIACAHGYRSVVYRIAEEHGIPLILWGDSQVESTSRMMETVTKACKQPQAGKLSKIARRFNVTYCRAEYLERLQRLEFHVPGNRLLSSMPPMLKNNKIRELRVFDYIQWDRNKIKDTISTQLGWEKPTSSSSTWRIDCKLSPLVNYEYLKRYGCSKSCFGYCNMINGRHMTRAEALQQEEATIATCADTLHSLLKDEIGLREDEVAQIC
jgi:tRNA(Ile)-lysidine synthase TilS/MesJ